MNKLSQQFMAQKIRSQYQENPTTQLDTLRALDTRVKRPVQIFSYVLGSLSALIMGSGMSLVMTEIATRLNLGDMMIPGIAIGVVGMALALLNYPLHKALLGLRRKKYAPEILRLTDELMK